MDWYRTSLFVICISCFTWCAAAQGYFKNSIATDLLDQKTAVFSNGDLLIGNSSTAPLRTGQENGILILKKSDQCGNAIWIKEYNYSEGYLLLKDIVINQNDDIFIYGSHYKGLSESIFISKIDAISLDVADFRVFNPGTVDHFTYSLDFTETELLVYGLLLDFNSSKEGFIGIFDHNLNFKRANRFTPFDLEGEARFSVDGGVISTSGPRIFKFDRDSNLEWVYKTTTNQQDISNISGPYVISDGYIFESHSNGTSFLYRLDLSGNVVWKSDQFEKINVGGDLSLMPNGLMSFVYNQDNGAGTKLSFLIIDQQGNTVQEKSVSHAFSTNAGVVKQHINGEDIIVIGSKNLFSTGVVDIENFNLKLNFSDLTMNCFDVVDVNNTSNNTEEILFDPEEMTSENFELIQIENVKLNSNEATESLSDICDLQQAIIPVVTTMELPCGEKWDVSLPDVDYRWDDGFDNVNRTLSESGIYSARNINCEQQEVIEFSLAIEKCACQIYVPTSFSPNGDGTNDTWQLGVFCDLESIDLSIYDKWGELMFNSQSMDKAWSGVVRDQMAMPGLYSAILNYTWLGDDGDLQEKKIIQTITLFR